MLSATTRLRVKAIINRLEQSKAVTLEERIYLTKLSKVSSIVASWLYAALGKEAHVIDEEI